jgi:hypothetical protein
MHGDSGPFRTVNVRIIYLVLCALGAVVPYIPFVAWFSAQPMNTQLPARFISELLSTRIGTFFGLDVVVSAIVLFGFMLIERKRGCAARLWRVVLGTLLVGVSLGLPLYLYERERSIAGAT